MILETGMFMNSMKPLYGFMAYILTRYIIVRVYMFRADSSDGPV